MLTRKQHQLLVFINQRLEETGVSPSFDEMKEALGLKSKSGIHRLITGLEEREYPQADVFRAAYAAANDINTGDIAAANEVSKIPDEIRKARIAAIRDVRTSA